MAQFNFRSNLQAATFPLLSELNSRTIIVPQNDQTYIPGVNPDSKTVPLDRGVSGIIYAHNIMPSTYGWQSVSYIQQVPEVNDLLPGESFDSVFFVQGAIVTEDEGESTVEPDGNATYIT